MKELIDFVSANWVEILGAAAAVYAAALAVVRITPSPKDDAVLAKIGRVLEKLPGFKFKEAK